MNHKRRYILILLPPLLLIVLLLLNALGYLNGLQELLDMQPFTYSLGSFRVSAWFVLRAAVLISLMLWSAALLVQLARRFIDRQSIVNKNASQLLIKLLTVGIYTFLTLVTIDALGIDLTTLTVLFGALGLGIGIGLQKITSNFFSGLILLIENQNQIGDIIEIPGVYGFIRRISLRFTLIEAFDGREVLIPNEDLMVNQVTNWTLSNNRGRVDINFGVAYGSDLRRVMRIAIEMARAHPNALKDPSDEPLCFIREFGDSSINFLLIFKVADVKEGRFGPQSDVMLAIYERFAEEGIRIPFPQSDVHLHRAELEGKQA